MQLALHACAITTGDLEFAVCPRHTAKTRRHTAKTLPTVSDGSHGDGKTLVRRVPNVGHTANLFAVCIYRHTAKKSEQTPSRPADGVGGSSPGACAVDTQQTYRLRRAPERLAHGKPSGFAVCPSGRHTAKDGHFAERQAHGEGWSLCRVLRFGTRQSMLPGRPIRLLCRVPWPRHTAK